MGNVVVQPPTGADKISPDEFRRWAQHFFKCYLNFESPDAFSPVPYFLCCRAIELHLKALHLRLMSQKEIRDKYSHDLILSYNDLGPDEQILDESEFEVLSAANQIYADKKVGGFEYFSVKHAGSAHSKYPDLQALQSVARRILDYDA